MYRSYRPSHRSNLRDTVLHLEIINPVARKTPSYKPTTGSCAFGRSTKLDYHNRIYEAGVKSRPPFGIDSFSNGDLQAIRLQIYSFIDDLEANFRKAGPFFIRFMISTIDANLFKYNNIA